MPAPKLFRPGGEEFEGGLGAGADVEFVVNVAEMPADGAIGETDAGGNLFIGKAGGQEFAHIHVGGNRTDEEGKGKGAEPSRGERESGLQRGIAQEGLKILRNQNHAPVEAEAYREHQEHSDGKGAILEGAQIDDGTVDGQLTNHEREQPGDATEEFDADIARTQPVLALAGIKKKLE